MATQPTYAGDGNNIIDEQMDPAQFGICCAGIVSLGSVMDWQGLFY